MSTRSARALWLACSILLTACVSTPGTRPLAPMVEPSAPRVSLPPATSPVAGEPAALPASATTWIALRNSFAMDDCDADPAIMSWARRYTRNPSQFESRLRDALPRLAYVQQVAEHYAVPGEFVLLPWVESQFSPVPGRRNRPAGMWQIMPLTAGSMGLRVDASYDARLDVPASATAVMKLLKQYHDQFNDWRVVDYAYNAGEFTIRKLVRQKGMPPAHPVIPQWRVHRVTREHLAKLLGMACVVREPGRFHVTLPVMPDQLRLVPVSLPRSMKFGQAADHAGMSVDALKDLNGAFRHDLIDTDASSYLLLPVGHAQQFRDALMNSASVDTGAAAAAAVPSASSRAGILNDADKPATSHAMGSINHRVKKGESLWQIAHHYSVTVDQLQHWNHLRGQAIKPGQILHIPRGR
jgi:membrane-bound lytic murein transglycosylase D